MVVRRTHFCLIAIAVLAIPASSTFAGYQVTDLGAYEPGSETSQGMGLNQAGVVVGTAGSGTISYAFRGGPGAGPLDDLGTLPGGSISHGLAINSFNEVVGDSTVGDGQYHAFAENAAGQKQDIGLLSGWTGSHATGINDLGQVVGYADLPGGVSHAFTWSPQTGLVDLGTYGGRGSEADAINAAGTVVGTVQLQSGMSFAFRKPEGAPVQVFSGLNGAGTISVGLAINNAGEVVGYGGPSTGYHAFRSLADGTLQDLGSLPGAVNSYANSVNNYGTIVGTATTSAGSSEAFVYSDATRMIDLNTLLVNGNGWELQSASGVNDYGQITGTGLLDGVPHAFLLTETLVAVPEPPAVVLAGLGLLALLVWHARRGCGQGAADRSA